MCQPRDVLNFLTSYEVVEKPEAAKDSLEQLASFIKENYRGQAGIVYTFSRKEASDVAAGLRSRGVSAAFYHAGQEASAFSCRTRCVSVCLRYLCVCVLLLV